MYPSQTTHISIIIPYLPRPSLTSLVPLSPGVKWTVPEDQRSRRHGQFQLSPANSTDTPWMLLCSHASPPYPRPNTNSHSGWITDLSHSISWLTTNNIIHIYLFKCIEAHRLKNISQKWKLSQICSSNRGHLNIIHEQFVRSWGSIVFRL